MIAMRGDGDNPAAYSGFGGVEAPWFDTALHWIALGMEAAGVTAIVVGVVTASAVYGLRFLRGQNDAGGFDRFRITLARGILLGLEFLVAADIIGTVAVKPTLQNLYVLGLIVLIRTFLSFALEIEIEGRLPWRKTTPEAPRPARPGPDA